MEFVGYFQWRNADGGSEERKRAVAYWRAGARMSPLTVWKISSAVLGSCPLEREVYFDYLHAVVLKLKIALEIYSVDVGGGNLLFPYYQVDAVDAL